MQQGYIYTIGDRQFTRDELLFFGRQHYPKFYWIKRGIGIGLLASGLLSCLTGLIIFLTYGYPEITDYLLGYLIGVWVVGGAMAIVGAILISVSFISLPDEAYIKHAIDYYTKLNMRNQAVQAKIERRNSVTNTNKTDQLLKYKELLDKGVITQEEFEAKKKELL